MVTLVCISAFKRIYYRAIKLNLVIVYAIFYNNWLILDPQPVIIQ